jgi:hypothetical protein
LALVHLRTGADKDLPFQVPVHRPLTPTSFVDNKQIVEGRDAVKLGPVLVLREPGPDLSVPIPRHTPTLGRGRHYPHCIVALSGAVVRPRDNLFGIKGGRAVRKTAMSPYKFAALCAGTITGIAVAVALGTPSHDGKFVKTAKYDVSGSQPDMQCPKLAWSYGCEWRPFVGSPTKHIVERRGHNYRLFEYTVASWTCCSASTAVRSNQIRNKNLVHNLVWY